MTPFDPALATRGPELLPLCIVRVDMDDPPAEIRLDPRYRGAYVVLERNGVAAGLATVAVVDGRLAGRLTLPHRTRWSRRRIPSLLPPEIPADPPLVTVAVCTRDRPDELAQCIEALLELEYPRLDLVVIDNAPSDDSTRRLAGRHSNVRYVCEPRPGLDHARNRAISEAGGEIIAFTDDDVVVSPEWVTGLVQAFTDHPDASCVTGLVLPYELETRAQLLFEVNGSFCRGFEQRRYSGPDHRTGRNVHLKPGIFGTGANMAFRRRVFDDIGGFDPALDVGTVTNGGGDLEIFLRLLEEGYVLVYDPRARVAHRHRRDMATLHRQFRGWGAYMAVLTCGALRYPRLRIPAARIGAWWMWHRHVRRLVGKLVRPTIIPMSLIWTEFVGSMGGLTSYARSRRRAGRDEAGLSYDATSRSQARATDASAFRPSEAPRATPAAIPLS